MWTWFTSLTLGQLCRQHTNCSRAVLSDGSSGTPIIQKGAWKSAYWCRSSGLSPCRFWHSGLSPCLFCQTSSWSHSQKNDVVPEVLQNTESCRFLWGLWFGCVNFFLCGLKILHHLALDSFTIFACQCCTGFPEVTRTFRSRSFGRFSSSSTQTKSTQQDIFCFCCWMGKFSILLGF